MAHLEIIHVSKSFGSFRALEDVSISIESGEFVCLLGASGCGKTTLLRLIAGLETQDRGTIELDGKDLSAVPCHKRNIGMVFQSLALFSHLNVEENVAYGMRLRGRSFEDCRGEVEHLLVMVGLDGLQRRSISALSGGQRQRVAIARALALQPDIFLMDEPFSALDAGLRDQMQLELKRLQRELGVTTILVTHDQREAMVLADRIAILNDGLIEQAGLPHDLYFQPASRFVAEFIGSNNLLDVDASSEAVTILGRDLGRPSGILSNLSGTCTVVIRPEEILMEHVPSRFNGLTGTIRSQRNLGATTESEIEVAGKTIHQSRFSGHAPTFRTGDRVALSWDWNRAWILPK